jgi:hypothetical protein
MTVRVYGTIERPGNFLSPRVPGAGCTSADFDDVHANVIWSVDAGTQSLGGGRLGQGRVRDDVNTAGKGPGPCSFPFDDIVDMPPGGDVVLHFANIPFPVNRTDLLAGPLTIKAGS